MKNNKKIYIKNKMENESNKKEELIKKNNLGNAEMKKKRRR